MGAYQNNVQAGGKKSKARGSTNNRNRLDAFANGTSQGSADWSACDPRKIQAVLAGITAMGGAITLGLSRDKGSHFLTLLLDDNKQTLWFNGDAVLDDELDMVFGILESMEA